MGYGLVVSRESILGSHKPEDLDEFEAYLSAGATQDLTDSAGRVAEVLRAHREFEVSTSEVGQVLIRMPSLLSGGFVIVKTAMRSFRVDIAVISTQSPFISETSERIARTLFEAVGERLYDGVTGIPYSTLKQVESLYRPIRIL